MHGVDHVVRLNGHQGLARAFTAASRPDLLILSADRGVA
jgi:hypothetical protein